jgi:N-sulfoglucosamine sulfohydrolase
LERPNILFAIADDWSWPHAGVYGDKTIKTPAFDRVAHEGILFSHSFCAAPTCTASRAAILTGQDPHRLEESANLWSLLQAKFPVYPDVLEANGYFVGCTFKGWGPGSVEAGGRTRNPAGPSFPSFDEFLAQKPKDAPFCYWFGSHYPHRPYAEGQGIEAGLKPETVEVPPYLPDTPEVRSDLLDYYEASQQYDHQIASLLESLDKHGLAENTLLVVTGDNGLPFPRAKTNLYDSGTRMPLAIRWPKVITKPGHSDDLIGFRDFAPTFLEAAGLQPLTEMTGISFLDILEGKPKHKREAVYFERERHTDRRPGKKSYPERAVRTKDFLYIRNLRPDLWPSSDPISESSCQSSLIGAAFTDIDGGPTKTLYLERRDDPKIKPFFDMACAKRPAEELYDIRKDPWQLKNVAGQPEYAEAKAGMRKLLDDWMTSTGDPRAKGETDFWDKCPYIGMQPRK